MIPSPQRPTSSDHAPVTIRHADDRPESMADTLVAIPAYNEERFIGSLVLQVRSQGYPVLVVDDGSTDQTAMIAREAGATVIRHDVNRGKAEALNTAFRYSASHDVAILVLLDGDAQHDPAEIATLTRPIREHSADIVIGSRFLQPSPGSIPLLRSIGQRGMTLATNWSSGTAVTDSQSGFRAFSRRAIDALIFRSHGFGVEGEMQFQVRDYDLHVVEVPITARYTDPPKRNMLYHGLHVLNSVLSLVERHRPLLFFGLPGLLSLTMGLGFGVLTTMIYQQTQVLAIGYGMLTVLGILVGLLAIFTGLTLHAVRTAFLDLELRIIRGPNRLATTPIEPLQPAGLQGPPPLLTRLQ